MPTVLSSDDRWMCGFLAAMSVQARRAMGVTDEAVIRREALDVAGKAIGKHVDDQVEQESWFTELADDVDREIRRTRPRRRA